MLELSQQQKAAVQYIKGPLLVLGGAGTGKTSLLVHKIAWLIREYDANPEQILAIAPTSYAARFLRARVADLVGHQIPSLQILTFSELGLAVIQQRFDVLGLLPGFGLYDRLDSEAVIARLLRENRPQYVGLAGAISRQIARWKREVVSPASEKDPTNSTVNDTAASLHRLYEQRLHTANAIDIEDLVRKAVRLFTIDAELLTEWRDRVRFLLIDEYEGASGAEHELVRLLTTDNTLLTAVGDENQLLGAPKNRSHPHNFARLRTEIPGIRILNVERNFRSTSRIARAAHAIVTSRRMSGDSSSIPARAPGARLRVLQTRSEQHEAESIVASLFDHMQRHEADYRDYAILFPRQEQAAVIERALQGQGVPYSLRGGPSFFDRTEVRDLWSYLRLLCNPADDIAFLRAVNTPRRDIDRGTLEQLLRFAEECGRPLLECARDPELQKTFSSVGFSALHEIAELLHNLSERTGRHDPLQLTQDLIRDLRYEDWLRDTCNDTKIAERRMQNVVALMQQLRRITKQRPEADLRALMTRLTLNAILDADGGDTTIEGVTLMPLAYAKGFEFPHVFLVGLEEGLMPAATEGERDLGEERRRAYIAISRARESLTLTLAEHRRLAGDIAIRQPSRFLSELAPDDVDWVNTGAPRGHAEPVIGTAARITLAYPPGHR